MFIIIDSQTGALVNGPHEADEQVQLELGQEIFDNIPSGAPSGAVVWSPTKRKYVDPRHPLLELLFTKGILTDQEADSIVLPSA